MDFRSLSELPEGALSEEEIQNGGIILYLLGIAFVFYALRQVCQNYFMVVINCIIRKYQIKPDIAGATLMAIAGSAPELFISFLGILVAGSNIGYTTILGSGAFNAMLLVGICAMAAKVPLDLQWWQVVRDFFFYIILLGLLIVFTYDLKVSWWEGLILFTIYIFYAVFMKFNGQIEKFVKKHLNLPYEGDDIDYQPLPTKPFPIRRYSISQLKDYLPANLNFRKGVLATIMRNAHLQEARKTDKGQQLINQLKHAVFLLLRAIQEKKRCDKRFKQKRGLIQPFDNENDGDQYREQHERIRKLMTIGDVGGVSSVSQIAVPLSVRSRLKRFLLYPFIILLKLTIPDVNKHKKLWLVSMIMSLVWIGTLSFLLIWWTLEAGSALGIPDSVLGMILLAAGVSVPDLVNSYSVTIEGHGDMALSGSLGSNIMNLSLGLGLPWLLYGAFIGDFSDVNTGIFYSEIFLISFIGTAYIFLAGFKWQLSKHLGGVMFFFYFSFLALFLIFEFN